jgi:uncharacterized protein YegJ (DUF2314 family)
MTLKRRLQKLTSNYALAVALLALQAWLYWRGYQSTGRDLNLASAVASGAAMLLLLVHPRSGVPVAIAVLLLICALKIGTMVAADRVVSSMLWTVGVVYLCWNLWKNPEDSLFGDPNETEPEDPSKQEPIISLVQLRDSPRYLEPVILANLLSEAWGLNISADEKVPDEADGFVTGSDQFYVAAITKPRTVWFMIYNFSVNYFTDAEEVAKGVPNLRFADIIRRHSAWLSVDLLPFKEGAIIQEEGYRLIGKATAALADDATLALMCPQHHYFNLWSPELETALCGEEPLAVFQEEVKAPVIPVKDTEIGDAIAEARRRWPEFVAAFQKRQPDDDRFIVKAPFTSEDGETEHMWLQVFGLEPEYVHGHLMNEPFHCKNLKQGSQVEVPVAEISDWLCPDENDEPIGNFTHQAVRKSARGEKAAS